MLALGKKIYFSGSLAVLMKSWINQPSGVNSVSKNTGKVDIRMKVKLEKLNYVYNFIHLCLQEFIHVSVFLSFVQFILSLSCSLLLLCSNYSPCRQPGK